jgi:hypothetical protein
MAHWRTSTPQLHRFGTLPFLKLVPLPAYLLYLETLPSKWIKGLRSLLFLVFIKDLATTQLAAPLSLVRFLEILETLPPIPLPQLCSQ